MGPAHEHKIKHTHTGDAAIDFISGGLGAVAEVYVAQPLDTVKVKMQTYPKLYKGMVECFFHTLKYDGISKGLYAGTVPALMTHVIEDSVLLLFYGVCQKFVAAIIGSGDVRELSMVSNGAAGGVASAFASIAITPAELIKCKMQATYELQKQLALKGVQVERMGPARMFKKILAEDGITGIFRGVVPTMAREVPGCFVYFLGYEGTRGLFRKEGQTKEDIGLLKTFMSGSVAGVLYWVILYPVDLVKSRVQVNKKEAGLLKVLGKIIKQDGVLGLYVGLKPSIIMAIPAAATLLTTYEYSRQFLYRIYYRTDF